MAFGTGIISGLGSSPESGLGTGSGLGGASFVNTPLSQ